MASSQQQHRAICIEARGDVGILFFKDFPTQLTKVYLRDQNLAQGKHLIANVTVLPSNELRPSKIFIKTTPFEFVKNTIRTYARVKIERAHMKYFPFSQIGRDDLFGEILIPNAMFEIGEELRVEIQYNDFFLDGIFWVATKYAKFDPDDPTRAGQLQNFSTDLTIPEQTLFPRVNKGQAEGASRRGAYHQGDRNQSTSSSDQPGRPVGNQNPENQSEVAKLAYDKRCILSFPVICTRDLSTSVNRNSETNYMLVLNIFRDYAVALVHPGLKKYGIISNTIQKYDELVLVGAFLEVALDVIEKKCFYSYVARSIYPCNSLKARVTPPNSAQFVFSAVMNYSDLFISNFSYDANRNEQFIHSNLGIVLFNKAALQKLVEFMDKGCQFHFTVQHIVHDCATWIAIDSKFYETDDPTPANNASAAADNDQEDDGGFPMKF